MKLLLLTALLGIASATLSASELQKQYLETKAKYMAMVPQSGADDKERFLAFSEVAQFVDDHNHEDSTWKAELNQFSIETEEEKKLSLGLNVSSVLEEQRRSLSMRRRSAPTLVTRDLDVDYTAYLPPIKNQGSCGSCWAFGATVALEYQVNKARAVGSTMRSLSEQQYLDCVYETQNHDGCNGGWPATCYSWTKNNGNMIASTADMPYTATDGACKTDTHSAISGFSVSGTQYLNSGDSYLTAAASDPDIGVLSVAIGVVNSFYSYGSGVYEGSSCNSINHAVDVVGYGVMNGVGYYRVRNSWGNWGDGGYINMLRGMDGENINMCAIASYAHYPVVSGADDGSNDDSNDGDNSDGDNSDGDDSSDDACWKQDVGSFSPNNVIGQTDFSTADLCVSMCGASSGCEAAVLSPETDGDRQCYLVNTENLGANNGWSTATMSCYQEGGDEEEEEEEEEEEATDPQTCTFTKSENQKFKGKISGLVYTMEECMEKCPLTNKCKGCSCKNKNKCMMNKKTKTKNNAKFDAYEMECSN